MPYTDAFEVRFKVAENGLNSEPSIEILWLKQTQGVEDTSPTSIGRKIRFLRFSKKTTYDEAQTMVRELNNQVDGLAILNFLYASRLTPHGVSFG
jgi:hypothetical protein